MSDEVLTWRVLTPEETARRYFQMPLLCRHCRSAIKLDQLNDWRHVESGTVRCTVGTEAEPIGEDREPLICGDCEEVVPRRDGEPTGALILRHATDCPD